MISYEKKNVPQPSPKDVADNRFEQIRKAAAAGHQKSTVEGGQKNEKPDIKPAD